MTMGLLVLVVAAASGGALLLGGRVMGRTPYNGPTFTVRKEKLRLPIVSRGSLESAHNGDVVCTVRAGQKGSTSSTVIKWLVDAGTEVTKGEKIMELDSSGFVEQLKDQNIKVDQAKAEMIKADEDYRIQEIENETEILKNQNLLELAQIDLDKYIEGDYEQAIRDVEGRITTAQSDVEDWMNRSGWSARMAKKGLLSKVQAEADGNRAQAAKIALAKLEEEKRVLSNYTKRRTIQDLNSKLKEAKLGLAKAKGQARAKLAQFDAARLSKKSVYEQELSRKREIETEIAKCTVLAPQDGLVVYYIPEQAMRGGGAQQSVVAQGEPVREGQKMIQIPDLTQMQVNVRVPEAFVSHLHSADPDDLAGWQRAEVRIDAFPSRILKGHVKTVDTVASQTDWFNADVKVYKTLVSIDELPSDVLLKPGMSAEVTITAEEVAEPVLVLPVQAVVGTINMGAKRKCFVVSPDGQTELRDIEVGLSNERLVEVRSGVKEGERVVENPRPLLGDDTEMKPGKVRTKAGTDHEGGSSGFGGQKKGKKKSSGGAHPPGAGNGVPGKGPSAGGLPGGAPSPEQLQQMRKAMVEKARPMTPAQRRELLNGIPEQFRGQARQLLLENNLKLED